MPAEFRDHRITLLVRDTSGSALRFYTDSGGGFNAISPSSAERLLARRTGETEADGATLQLVEFPQLLVEHGIPRPDVEDWLHGGLAVVPDVPFHEDGFLGSRWFAGKIWEIDYPRASLRRLTGLDPTRLPHRTVLGFQTAADGRRRFNFPRVTMTVDDQPVEMLLDTGATITLTAASAIEFARPAGTAIGGSFIARTVFERWAARHPDWRVLAAADALGGRALPMIEVPRISIAGLAVGPVWFAQRPDENFHSMMSEMMDRRVDGAVGGSGLKYFRVTLDYPAAIGYFERPGEP